MRPVLAQVELITGRRRRRSGAFVCWAGRRPRAASYRASLRVSKLNCDRNCFVVTLGRRSQHQCHNSLGHCSLYQRFTVEGIPPPGLWYLGSVVRHSGVGGGECRSTRKPYNSRNEIVGMANISIDNTQRGASPRATLLCHTGSCCCAGSSVLAAQEIELMDISLS
jgi:hypothetical protein